MVILTLIGMAVAFPDSLVVTGDNHLSALCEFVNPFDAELYDHDVEEEKPESETDKETSHQQHRIPEPYHEEIHQKVIEV